MIRNLQIDPENLISIGFPCWYFWMQSAFNVKSNLIQQKSFAFAIRIIETYKFLVNDRREFVLSKQLVRSGTSVGANIEESIGAHTRADFLWRLSIAYREAREVLYWLKLLKATHFLGEEIADSLSCDAEELCRIIGKIQITAKAKMTTK